MQDRQDEREANPISPRRNPTAACGDWLLRPPWPRRCFFAHGARAVGRPEAPDVVDAMRRLGYDFGKLVYLLDAFEDYEKDWREGEFNALRAAFGRRTC
ncbi:MAG TPA: DUF5685 family protein [Blastocatellia bacterium]|nr:DUF5685 family protein [Blastocatellia bacterium]